MSATATPPAQKMTPEQGRDFQMREIFIPTFFNKLASHGLSPVNEEEAGIYLDIGLKALNAHQAETVKTAGTRTSFLKEANSRLDQVMNERYGFTVPQQQQKTAADEQIRKDVDLLLTYPAVREALLASQAPQA